MTTTSTELQSDCPPRLRGTVLAHILRGGSLKPLLPLSDVDDESLYAVGYHLYAQARYAQALPIFGILVARSSMERRFRCAFAACLQVQGRHKTAVSHYLLAATIDPTDPVPILGASECLIAMGKTEEAKEGLTRLQDLCKPPVHDAVLKKAQGLLDLMTDGASSRQPGGQHANGRS